MKPITEIDFTVNGDHFLLGSRIVDADVAALISNNCNVCGRSVLATILAKKRMRLSMLYLRLLQVNVDNLKSYVSGIYAHPECAPRAYAWCKARTPTHFNNSAPILAYEVKKDMSHHELLFLLQEAKTIFNL